jgi:hypothetical protein
MVAASCISLSFFIELQYHTRVIDARREHVNQTCTQCTEMGNHLRNKRALQRAMLLITGKKYLLQAKSFFELCF